MKTIGIRASVKSLLTLIAVFVALEGFSQPELDFRNPSLISGTDRQTGAKYRFPNVKSGVDCIVSVNEINKVTLDDIDGGSGFREAFQPVITAPRKTNGYVEFQLDFVNTGTTTARIMPEVPITAIDIDGYIYPDEKVYEFDEFKVTPNCYINYDFIGTSLDVKIMGSWVQALNKTAADYPGIDTVQKDVMFSMVHAGVSSIIIRVGADNKSRTSTQRLRSVYFKKFNYPNSVLAQSPLTSFTGKKEGNNVALNWKFISTEGIQNYNLERSVDGQDFISISSASVNSGDIPFSYTDPTSGGNSFAYRLKVNYANGKTYYSQIIVFKNNENAAAIKMNIFPNVIQSSTSVQVNSELTTKTTLQVVDYSGRTVYRTALQLNKGVNSFYLELGSQLAKGNYIVVLPVNGTMVSEKIVIRQ